MVARTTADGQQAGYKICEGFLVQLRDSALLDTLCSALLRMDPSRPPAPEGVLAVLMSSTSLVLVAVHSVMRCVAAAITSSPGGWTRSDPPSKLSVAVASQPHVLKLLHAVAEAFLQKPLPPFATAAGGTAAASGGSGRGSSWDDESTAALAAEPIPGRAAAATAAAALPPSFLPSSSPADQLSNKMLQRTWPLLAVCPMAQHVLKPARSAPTVPGVDARLNAAAGALEAVQIWVVAFGSGAGQLTAVKQALPGFSGFCRVAARAARWSGFAAARVAADLIAERPVHRDVGRIFNLANRLQRCVMRWPEVSRL